MKQYAQLVTGFILLLFLGVAYAWSLFVTPLEDEFGWSRDKTSLIFTVSMVCFCLGGILGGVLNSKYKHRLILFCAAGTMAAGFIGCANVNLLWQIYLFYGVLCGLSIGVLYNIVISIVNSWFENRIGFASGIMMMGYGMGSFILGSFVSYFNIRIGWRNTYYVLAAVFAILIVAAALILTKKQGTDDTKLTTKPLQGQMPPNKMLHTKTFYSYYFWGVSVSAIGLAVIGHASLMAASLGATTSLVVAATGAFSISNGISRVIFGMAYDRWGRRKTMKTISGLLGVGVVFLNLALFFESLPLLFLAYGFTGSGFGGCSPCNSAFVKEYYGERNYGRNFSIMTSAGILASLAGPYVLGFAMFVTNSYAKAYPFFLIFVLSAFILQYLLTKWSTRRELKTIHWHC